MAPDRCDRITRKPTFSFVVAADNVEPYIGECLDSIYAQTDACDFEVVVVNDGSTDHTLDVVNARAAAHPERTTRVITQENAGLLAARRAGYAAAAGEWIASVDGDDVLEANMLAQVASAIDRFDVDLVCFGYTGQSATGTYPDGLAFLLSESEFADRERLVERYCSGVIFPAMWLKVFRRSLLQGARDYAQFGRFQYAEDLLQSNELIDRARSAYLLHDALYRYRYNGEGLSRVYRPERFREIKTARRDLEAYAAAWEKELGVADLLPAGNAVNLRETYYCVSALLSAKGFGARRELASIGSDAFFRDAFADPRARESLSDEALRTLTLLSRGKLFRLMYEASREGRRQTR